MESIPGMIGVGALIYILVPILKAFTTNEKARVAIVVNVSLILGVLAIASTGQLDNGVGSSLSEIVTRLFSIFGAGQGIYILFEKALNLGIDKRIETSVEKSIM